jgi:hypothetical protein
MRDGKKIRIRDPEYTSQIHNTEKNHTDVEKYRLEKRKTNQTLTIIANVTYIMFRTFITSAYYTSHGTKNYYFQGQLRPVLRIRDVYPRYLIPDPYSFHPGSRLQGQKDSGSRSASKNLRILSQKNVSKLSEI